MPVGFNDTWTRPREYQLARGVLKPGKNVIAVAVLDSGGGGGLWGDPKQRMLRFASGETVLLDGAWRYRPASPLAQTGIPPRAPWGDSQGMSTLYNAMIAPLAGYTLAASPGIRVRRRQRVGGRLALAARRLIYGEDIVTSGPTPMDARRAAGQVVVRFSNAASGLVVYGDKHPIGFELCDDGNRCEYADATVHDDRVLLEVGSIGKPSRVRYAWADSPLCNLYNESDLPAVPFEIRIQE